MASIAQMTGTLLDSGCKHIIPVRVNLDFYLERCDTSQDVLLRNKMKFSAHKGDLLLCVGSNMFEHGAGSYEHNDAYPPIISTIVEKESELSAEKQLALALVYCLQHNELRWGNGGLEDSLADNIANVVTHHVGGTIPEAKLAKWLKDMPDFRFMGFSLGLGYAHPNSGDNVVSSLIGGMMTVRNGDFPMRTGDRVQWYFYFEKGLFEGDGKRIKADMNSHADQIVKGNGRLWPNQINQNDIDPYRMSRYIHAMQQNAVYDVNIPSKKRIDYTIGKIGAATIKPYFEAYGIDEYPLDRIRVFAKAVSNARPYDNVDIIICTQCI